MIQRASRRFRLLSENVLLRALWYILLILLAVLLYQGQVPFVYAKF